MKFTAAIMLVVKWFTPDRALAVVGIAAGIIAIRYEIELHHQFILQEAPIQEIVSSVKTRYVARFPENLEYATNIISAAKSGDEILILNDVIGYGYYSCPSKFEEYIKAIKHASEAKAHVRILIYGDMGTRKVLTTQFPRQKYESWIMGLDKDKKITNGCQTDSAPQTRLAFYLNYYNLPLSLEYEKFLNDLIEKQNRPCRQLTAEDNIEIKTIAEEKSKLSNNGTISQPIFFWLLKNKDMVFAYPYTGQIGKGASFISSDDRLMEIFVDQFDDVWQTAEKVSPDCYSAKALFAVADHKK